VVFRGIPNGIVGSLKSSLPEVHAAIEQFIPHSLTKQSFASLLADYQRLKLLILMWWLKDVGLMPTICQPFFCCRFLF